MAIFIISNRDTYTDNNGKLRFEERANSKAGHSFRIAEVKGNGSYTIVDDLNESGYQDVLASNGAVSGSALMFKALYEAESNKKGDILFFIHGFNYAFSDNLKHIKTLKQKYLSSKSPVKHLVYVSWPSRGRLFKYKGDQPDARETGRMLGRLLEKLRRFFIDAFEVEANAPCRQKIHLGAHSMGNQVLYYMLQSVDESQLFPVFSEVCLFHADAPADGFEGNNAFTRLPFLSERTHIYIHRSDDALWISDNLKGNSKRLGRKGPTNPDSLPVETHVVDTSTIKDSSVKQEWFDHWGYLERHEIISDVLAVFSGEEEDDISKRKRHPAKANTFILQK